MTVPDIAPPDDIHHSQAWATELRRWPIILLIIIVPIFSVGLFCRGIWTPDEPREIALAWNMATQDNHAVPQLGDEAFCEKPPLTYWVSGASMAIAGKSPGAARLPQLFYALLGAFSLAWLAHGMVTAAQSPTTPTAITNRRAALAALATGIVFSTMELTWQVAIWLASDAPLLMGACIALLGAWRGAQAETSAEKVRWYLLMHLGMLIGFFSKNIIGWITPGLALTAWLIWEKRTQELLRWELWIGFIAQLLLITPWVLWVGQGANGTENLRILFIENILGRFLPWFKGTKDYNSGHANFPGKYLLEIPAYVLPWLFIALAALTKAWTACRIENPQRSAWRFALCILVPNFLLLSVASTARGIYLAPCMTGFAVFVGLWAAAQLNEQKNWDRRALAATGFLISGIVTLVFPIVLAASRIAGIDVDGETWILLGACSVIGLVKTLLVLGYLRRENYGQLARECVITLLALWVLVGVAAPRIVDRWQDLRPIADTVATYAAHQRMIIMNADETTRAMMQYHAGLALPCTEDDVEVKGRPACLALRKMPTKAEPYARTVAELQAKGWHVKEKLSIPFGRCYTIFASDDLR